MSDQLTRHFVSERLARGVFNGLMGTYCRTSLSPRIQLFITGNPDRPYTLHFPKGIKDEVTHLISAINRTSGE